jgi:Right handed beta helix region
MTSRKASGILILPALFLLAACSTSSVEAKTLIVGPDQALKAPSAAARVASDGDTIKIEPKAGGYYDCAVWGANNLTIEGEGAGVILTDTTCQGKAIFVTVGKNITIRNLTFQRARVPDQNGAGIRAEGANLTIEHSRFIDNQDGILTAASPQSKIVIRDSEFIGNGFCGRACSHAIYAGDIGLLRIEHSVFRDTHAGHDVKSRALRTELIGNTIEDGPNGTSSYLVDISNGGALVMRGNTLEKGPKSSNHSCAVTIGEEGVRQPTPEITIADNKFTNDMPYPTVFVRNLTATPAKLTGNTFTGRVTPLSGDGSVH